MNKGFGCVKHFFCPILLASLNKRSNTGLFWAKIFLNFNKILKKSS